MNGEGIVPVTNVGGNDAGFGGGWIGMVLVLALLSGGLGFGRGERGREDAIGNDFLYSALNTNTQAGFTNLQDQINHNDIEARLFGIQGEVSRVGFDNALGQKDIIHAQDMGFCSVNRNVDGVRFENERNTSRIIESQDRNTQRILDRMCADELRLAYAKIAEQNQALSEARIIGAMKPVAPIPAYLQPNPYENFGRGFGPGFGPGFGV